MFKRMLEGFGRKQPEMPPTPPKDGLPNAAERVNASFSAPSRVRAGFDRGPWTSPEPALKAPEPPAAQSPEGANNVVPIGELPTNPFEAQPLDYEALGAWSRAKSSPPESRELPEQKQDDAKAA